MIELVFSAVGLGDELIVQWAELNKPILEMIGACVVTDSDTIFPGLRIVRIAEQERYDIGSMNNLGIRSSEADIIIKGDVDIYYSRESIRAVENIVRPGVALCQKCANLTVDNELSLGDQLECLTLYTERNWGHVPIRPAGRGACFAMHKDDWKRLCGYDERFRGWGSDDDSIFRRAQQEITVIQSARHPIIHINHRARISARFPNCGQQNMTLMDATEPWHETPESENWGLDLGDLGDILAGECDIEKI